ncbi:MAG TPA: MEDS domain-containing protein [Bryobacteraceae bacterium]|jgi:MEDS: MEthanogen/methylotroph, DcmR Sensory domain|nr:MEDS domain-containing protein [Bryobacteraceae bacterium]
MDVLARHQCMIYEGSPTKHLPGLAALIYAKLKTHHRCLYLNSPPMLAGIRSYLYTAGVDVDLEVRRGALVLSSDQSHLVKGCFNVAKMLALLVAAVEEAIQDGYTGLWAAGDMTWELGSEMNLDILFDYEQGLEEVFRRYPALGGVCMYHRDTLPINAVGAGLHLHQALYINETLTRMNPYYGSVAATRDLGDLELSDKIEALMRHFDPTVEE